MRSKPSPLNTVNAIGDPDPANAAARTDAAVRTSALQASPLTEAGQAATVAAAASPASEPELPEDSARRLYHPPRILFREPLEAMAAICTPHPPAKSNKGLCPMGPISS